MNININSSAIVLTSQNHFHDSNEKLVTTMNSLMKDLRIKSSTDGAAVVAAQNIAALTGIGSKLDIKDGVNNIASSEVSSTTSNTQIGTESRIRDVDFASEASGLLNAQVVHQSVAASPIQQAETKSKSLLNLFA